MSVPPFMAQDPRNDALVNLVAGGKIIDGQVVELIPGKTDQARAAELKRRTLEVMEPFLRLKDEAAKDGFLIVWQGIAPNSYGRHEIVDLHLVKRF